MDFTGVRKEDNYYTCKETWEKIDSFIPKNKVLWEPFYGDGKSGEFLRDLGCKKVIHSQTDFFDLETRPDFDCIITNCPFSLRLRVFQELKKIDKPFIMIMMPSVLSCKWFLDIVGDADLQLIIPKKRVKFYSGDQKNYSPNGGTFYFCWKMGYSKDLNII